MKKTILFLSAFALLISACKQDPKGSGSQSQDDNSYASPLLLSGHWVAMDFCSRANQYGSVLAAMNQAHLPYAYALSFDVNNPDSVVCNNGLESWTCEIKFNADTLEIVNARDNKSVFLLYHSQGERDMTMFDPTQGGRVKTDKFIKSGANTLNGYTAFATALNHNLFDGLFTSIRGGGGKKDLQFTPGGFILNWGLFDRYSVCTAGDCFVSGNEIDVITLSKYKKEGSEQLYGFRFSASNDTLSFYNMYDPKPGELGAYEIKGIAHQFVRKSTQ